MAEKYSPDLFFDFEFDFDEDIPILLKDFEEPSCNQVFCIKEDEIDVDFIKEVELNKIPQVVYVDDSDIATVVVHRPESSNPAAIQTTVKQQLVCSNCNKEYKRKDFFSIHVKFCEKKKKQKLKVKEAGKQNQQKSKEERRSAVTLFCSESEFEKHSKQFVQEVFNEALTDPVHQISTQGCKIIEYVSLLSKLLMSNPNSMDTFLGKLQKEIFKLISEESSKCFEREKLFSEFEKLSLDNDLFNQWKLFLPNENIESSTISIMFQYLLEKFFKKSLQLKNQLCIVPKSVQRKLDLEKSEEETIQYVSGYIIYSIIREVKGNHSKSLRAVQEILSLWGSKTEPEYERQNLDDYVKDWVDRVNRGGLIRVNSEFFLLIKEMELEARFIVNKTFLITYCGENIFKITCEKIKSSNEVMKQWDILTRNIENKGLCDGLFEKILRRWVNIRLNSFIKSWVLVMRREKSVKAKLAEAGAKSFRKEL